MMDDVDTDMQLLIRDAYAGDHSLATDEDRKRIQAGEPLAYIIGWIPFLSLKIWLDSHPLIPRPETEWWTELLIARLRTRFDTQSFTLFDLCAGSGAIGLSVLKAFPNAHVYFGELIPEHCALIQKNIQVNALDASRATIIQSDLFTSLPKDVRFDCIATNPPYIPEERVLEESVTVFEPSEALFAGSRGLSVISRIAEGMGTYIAPDGELWMECDIENGAAAEVLLAAGGARRTELLIDLYDRPRLVVAYFYHEC